MGDYNKHKTLIITFLNMQNNKLGDIQGKVEQQPVLQETMSDYDINNPVEVADNASDSDDNNIPDKKHKIHFKITINGYKLDIEIKNAKVYAHIIHPSKKLQNKKKHAENGNSSEGRPPPYNPSTNITLFNDEMKQSVANNLRTIALRLDQLSTEQLDTNLYFALDDVIDKIQIVKRNTRAKIVHDLNKNHDKKIPPPPASSYSTESKNSFHNNFSQRNNTQNPASSYPQPTSSLSLQSSSSSSSSFS